MPKPILHLAVLGVAAICAMPGRAAPVDVELLFLNDASGSIDAADFDLQIDGFAAAFRSDTLIGRIAEGAVGGIAVSVAFFANTVVQAIPFTRIATAADGEAFARALEALVRPDVGVSDAQANALNVSQAFFDGNGFEGARNVIDVVTEGTESYFGCMSRVICAPLQQARDAALAGNVSAINALVLDDRDFFGNDPEDEVDAETYALANLVGGADGFAVFVEDFSAFAPAIEAKIIREIAPPPLQVPLPGGLPLLAGAVALLGLHRKKGWSH